MKKRILNSGYFITEQGQVLAQNGHTLKPHITKKGYLRIRLASLNQSFLIHRLIAIAFIPNPKKCTVVNHLDGDKLNNSIHNLEWCTVGQNQKHAYTIGLRKQHKGQLHGRAVLTDKTVLSLRKMYSTGKYSLTDVGFMFGISKSNVEFIVKRKTWTHI